MKKLLSIGFIFMAFCMCYAERNNRINYGISLDLGSIRSGDDGEKVTCSVLAGDVGLEYTRILENSFIVGGGASWGMKTVKWDNSGVSVEVDGTCFSLYPVIGRAFGDNQNTQVLIYPLKIDSVSVIEVREHINGTLYVTDSPSMDFTMYKTGVAYCKQWGQKLFRYGFIVGSDLIWGSSGDLKNSTGVEFLIGGRLSWGF